jgi:hypothetical protein
MRAALATTVLAAAAMVASPPAPAGAVSPAKLAAAVRSAERSRSLWATINICDSHRYPDSVGVRGQMPALGVPASLSMVVQVDYWATGNRRFIPIQSKTATMALSLGRASSGLQQDGAVFPFKGQRGLFNATITFTWSHGGKVIGQTERRTTAGHHDADFGSPPRYSAAQCRIR